VRARVVWRNSHSHELVSAACTHSFIPVTQDVDITCNQWVNAICLSSHIHTIECAILCLTC
jgi:hypothetical protein